jgi:hypothetical protein
LRLRGESRSSARSRSAPRRVSVWETAGVLLPLWAWSLSWARRPCGCAGRAAGVADNSNFGDKRYKRRKAKDLAPKKPGQGTRKTFSYAKVRPRPVVGGAIYYFMNRPTLTAPSSTSVPPVGDLSSPTPTASEPEPASSVPPDASLPASSPQDEAGSSGPGRDYQVGDAGDATNGNTKPDGGRSRGRKEERLDCSLRDEGASRYRSRLCVTGTSNLGFILRRRMKTGGLNQPSLLGLRESG